MLTHILQHGAAMDTFYIIDPNAPMFNVWMRKPRESHKPGYFTRDFDAAYLRRDFAYTTMHGAVRQANRIMAERDMKAIEVVTRERLFEILGVEDWSKGF